MALVPILAFGLWNLGALVAGRVTRERVRLLPWAFGGGAARAAAIGAMAYVAYHTNPTDDNRLTTFLICLGGFGFPGPGSLLSSWIHCCRSHSKARAGHSSSWAVRFGD
ncbi:MAG: hypothetical protein R2848_08915 [Thermomicrobiales bacterium]